jgi:Ca-activated chloride channel homolog
MHAARFRAAGVALVAALVWAEIPASRAQQQFRAGVDLVRLPVVVSGKNGLFVRGLVASDFQITEDGVAQAVSVFAEGAPGDALPLHLGLLLDGSESMEADLRDAANAAVQFVTALEEAADVTFVDFDSSVRMARFTPDHYPRLFERIRQRKARGQTSLYDAIGAYLETAQARSGQHVLLVYTDGGENMSRMTYPQLVDALRFSNVVVYALGYLNNQVSSARLTQESRLTALARETGGDALFPVSMRELQTMYARILDEIGSRYTIGYESSNTRADGRFRRVQVRLARADLRSARVRTRSGYLAPVTR